MALGQNGPSSHVTVVERQSGALARVAPPPAFALDTGRLVAVHPAGRVLYGAGYRPDLPEVGPRSRVACSGQRIRGCNRHVTPERDVRDVAGRGARPRLSGSLTGHAVADTIDCLGQVVGRVSP